MTKQLGISLVELMLSLCLASLLMTVVMQVYLKGKQNYVHINELLEENFDLQLVSDLIRNSLRQAGFTPCISIRFLQSIDSRDGRVGLAAIETKDGAENTLAINRMSEHFTLVEQQLNQTDVLLRPSVNFSEQQTILIADCYHAEVHQILKAQKTKAGTIIKLANALTFDFIAPIYLGEWVEEKFFIQKNRRGVFALFYQQNHAEELSNQVKELFFELKSSGGKNWVALKLGLEKSEPLVIETEIRA